jgi:hypothetical protein
MGLLLLTLLCLLPLKAIAGGALATADAFARDVAGASPAQEVAASSSASSTRRSLPVATFVFSGDTTSAALSSGNLIGACSSYIDCINGCRSHFYKVTGGTGGLITASTCGTTSFGQRTYVWKGSSAACSSFTCTSTFVLFVCMLVML